MKAKEKKILGLCAFCLCVGAGIVAAEFYLRVILIPLAGLSLALYFNGSSDEEEQASELE